MKKLYKFHLDCGRMGDVEGLFVEEEDVVNDALGKPVYFGEILGKHSEVYCDLEEQFLSVVSEDQDFIKKFEDIVGGFGYNPLDYISEEEEEEEEEEEVDELYDEEE